MMQYYDFDYNLPFENDTLAKADCFIPVRAELLPLCYGMPPMVAIIFRDVFSTQILRVKNLHTAVKDMEQVAMDHFATTLEQPFSLLELIDLN